MPYVLNDCHDALREIEILAATVTPITVRDQRIARLEQELRELREANEILRKVAGHFASTEPSGHERTHP